jgi:hypothetical protein
MCFHHALAVHEDLEDALGVVAGGLDVEGLEGFQQLAALVAAVITTGRETSTSKPSRRIVRRARRSAWRRGRRH